MADIGPDALKKKIADDYKGVIGKIVNTAEIGKYSTSIRASNNPIDIKPKDQKINRKIFLLPKETDFFDFFFPLASTEFVLSFIT